MKYDDILWKTCVLLYENSNFRVIIENGHIIEIIEEDEC